MPLVIQLNALMVKRKMTLAVLSKKVGITMTNLSRIKKGKIKMIRLDVLESLCMALSCQPKDLFIFEP